MTDLPKHLGRIGFLLNEIAAEAGKYERGMVYVEGGALPWSNGLTRGKVWGPFKTEDEAHNYIAVKIERHKLANAKFHGKDGNPPSNDREYMGHPLFQYRILDGREYIGRYLLQIQGYAGQALLWLLVEDEIDVTWPAADYGPDHGGVEDGDEFPDEEDPNK